MTYNPFSLSGKTILITGASSGIGRATAIECSRLGAKICVTGRNEHRLMETLLLLHGGGHSSHIADLTVLEQVEELVDNLPKLDGVVHSAGMIPEFGTPSFYIENENMIDIFRSNVLHIINLNALLIQLGKLSKSASIVHISSYAANYPSLGLGMYCMTKSALTAYSKTLATELTYKKIRVNTLLPGMIDTETVVNITTDNPHFDKDRESYPFGYGKPEDVAWACIYLLSDAARWITGSEFTLDGGSLLKWK